MAMFEKQGSPFLFDDNTKDIVALRDPDGSHTPILSPTEVGNLRTSGVAGSADVGSLTVAISGIITGCAFSATVGTGVFSIASGTLRFVDDYTTPGSTSVTDVTYAGVTGAADSYPASDATYIGINSSGDVVQQTTPFSMDQARTICPICVLAKSSGLIIASAGLYRTAFNERWFAQDLYGALGPVVNGVMYSGIAGLQLARSAGSIFRLGADYPGDRKTSNEVSLLSQSPVSFAVYARNGSNTVWSNSGLLTTFDPTKYDNGGSSTAGIPTGTVTTNKWQAVRVHISTNGYTLLQYGTAVYNTLDLARAGVSAESYYPAPILSLTPFRGYMFVRGGASNLNSASDCVFVMAGKLGDAATATGVTTAPASLSNSGYSVGLDTSGHLIPGDAGTQNLGSSAYPFNLMYDKRPMFAAFASSDQPISSNVDTKVTLATEEYDTASGFAASRYTAAVAGYYRFVSRGRFLSKTSVTISGTMQLWKNGAVFGNMGQVNGVISTPATNMAVLFGEITLYLAAGDYVELYCNLTSSDSSTITLTATSTTNRSNTTWMEGGLVRPGAA